MSEIDTNLGVSGGGLTPGEPIVPLQEPQTEKAPEQLGDKVSQNATTQDFNFSLFTPGTRILLQSPSTDPSYLQYLETISTTLTELKNMLGEIEIQDHLKSRELMASLAASAFAINELYSEINSHYDTWKSVNTRQNGQIGRLNNLIKNYNDNEGAEPFKTALMEEAALFNLNVDQNNQVIELLNFQRENLGIGLLPLQERFPYTDPSELPEEIDPIKSVKAPPKKLDWIETYFAPIYESLMAGIAFLMHQHELSEAFLDVMLLFLRGKNPSLPNAYIDNLPQAFFSNTGGGAAGGLNSLTGISSPSLERSLGRELFLHSLNKLLIVLPQRTLNELEMLNLQLMSKIGISSTLPATHLLSDHLNNLNPASLPIKVALAISFLSGIKSATDSSSINNIVRRILSRKIKGLGFGRLAALTQAITSSIKLSMLGFGLIRIAVALGLPGLVPNLLGNVPGILRPNLAIAANQALHLNDVLGNAVSRTLLKSALAERLASARGMSSSYAQTVVNNVINNLATLSLGSDASIRGALYAQFQAQGIGSFQSRLMANAAINFLKDEARLPFLDTTFSLASLNQALLVNTLSNTLALRGYDIEAAGFMLNNAIRRIQDVELETKRQLRDGLQSNFQQQGLGAYNSRLLANQAVEFLERGSIGLTFGNSILSEEAAKASIVGDLRASGLSQIQAENIAENSLERTISRGPFATSEEFNRRLKRELGRAGYQGDNRKEIAESATANLQIAQLLNNPLLQPGLSSSLSAEELVANLSDKVIGDLSSKIGVSLSQKIANELSLMLVGVSAKERDEEDAKRPNSILSLINHQVEHLKVFDRQLSEEKLYDIFREFIHIKPETLVLNERMLRPAATEFDSLLGPSSNKRDVMFLGGV